MSHTWQQTPKVPPVGSPGPEFLPHLSGGRSWVLRGLLTLGVENNPRCPQGQQRKGQAWVSPQHA